MCTATAIRFGLFAASHLFLVSSLIREEENRVVNVIVFNSLLSATRNGGKNERTSKQASKQHSGSRGCVGDHNNKIEKQKTHNSLTFRVW
jgi:hypothetical protein